MWRQEDRQLLDLTGLTMKKEIEIEYKNKLVSMMAIAGLATRSGFSPYANVPIYDAWEIYFPKDAYVWISKALIEMENNNNDKALKYLQDAIDQAETNTEIARSIIPILSD